MGAAWVAPDRESPVHLVNVLTAFSELIGNGDRHLENLSLMTDERGQPVEVSPAYDMLPMMYAPVGDGIEPPLREVAPSVETLGAGPTCGGSPSTWLGLSRKRLPTTLACRSSIEQ